MTDGNDYVVVLTDGKEEYQCNHCETKYGSQKSIKTHVTVKHKMDKNAKKATQAEETATSPPGSEMVEESFVTSDLYDGFEFDAGIPTSTQVSTESVDDILKMYEDPR